MGALHGAVLLRFRLWRFEELGDDLDREHAVDPAFVVDHGGVLRLALEQVGEGVAHDVVAVDHGTERQVQGLAGTVSARRSRSESQPSGAALAVDQQRVGRTSTSGWASFARTSAVGWPT